MTNRELDLKSKIEAAYGSMKLLTADKRQNVRIQTEEDKKNNRPGRLSSELMAEKLIQLTESHPNGAHVLLQVANHERTVARQKSHDLRANELVAIR